MATSVMQARQYALSAAGLWAPVGPTNPLPALIRDPVSARSSRISSFGALHAVPVIGLVNSTFYSAAALTTNYAITNAGSGATTANSTDGFFTMTTGATAGSTSQIVSNDQATYNGIGPLLFLNGLRLGQVGTTGVIRRWGMFSADGQNGYFFEDRDGVLGVVSRKNGADTRVASANFNGTVVAADTNAHIWEIEVTGGRAVFSQDNVLLHTITPAAGTTTTSATLILVIRVDIANGANAAAYTMEGRGQNIARIGSLDSKRLNETLFDAQDADLSRAVTTIRTGADLYATASGTVVGTKNVLDVNLLASAGNVAATTGTLSAAVANNPGTATTVSTTAQIITNVANSGNATWHLVTSAFVGTVVYEVSLDGGLNYSPIMSRREDGTASESFSIINTAAPPPFIRAYVAGMAGVTHFRVRCSAFTSGTLAVYITQGPFLIEPSPSLGASTANIGTVSVAAATAAYVRTAASLTAVGNAADAATTTGTFVVPTTGQSGVEFTIVPPATPFAVNTVFEVSPDSGTTWLPTTGVSLGTGSTEAQPYLSSGGTTKVYWVSTPSMTHVRFRVTAITGGTLAVQAQPSAQAPPSVLAVLVDSARQTFSSGAGSFATAFAGDIFNFSGTSNRLVRLTRIGFSMSASTAGLVGVTILMRTTANTAGTSAVLSGRNLDPTSTIASATNLLTYSAAPTAGTAGTILGQYRYFAPAAAQPQLIELNFGAPRGVQAPTLRRSSDSVSISLAAAITGAISSVYLEWTEE